MGKGHMEQGKNIASIKQENRSVILNAIRSAGGLSRVEISRNTGLSKGGITPIITELMELGLVCETSVLNSGSGRKPVLLEINRNRCYVISIDWSRRGLTAALLNFGGDILRKLQFPFPKGVELTKVLKKLRELVKELLKAAADKPVLGIGLVVPGPLDYEKGMILEPPNFNGWNNIEICRLLEEWFQLPVCMDNNGNAHALAEKEYGFGRNYGSFLHLIVDEGIGGAIILDRRIYRGATGLGNELGHMTIDFSGPRCQCGNYGCLELYATVPQIVDGVNREKEKKGSLNGGKYTFEEVLMLLENGDADCIQVMKREAAYLGAVCISLINALEPEAIIIGSQLAKAAGFITGPLKEYIKGKTMVKDLARIPVLTSKVEDASILGGATVVLDRVILGEWGNFESLFSL